MIKLKKIIGEKMKTLKNKKLILTIVIFIIVIFTIIGISYSEILSNDAEVEPNSNLTYYLDVSYDGIDHNGIESNDTTIAEVSSGIIKVSDKIPEGLSFVGFVTTNDGTIGASHRDNETACIGKVVDDTKESVTNTMTCNNGVCYYHGLHYDESTRTVTFQVSGLKAGCKLTVGIITKTPTTIDDPNTNEVETRRDFYNYGSASEENLAVISNTVHAFMGKGNVSLHNVKYNYTGDVPSNAPPAPLQTSYAEGIKVGVYNNVYIEGYTFSGWTTNDATVTDGSFLMPNNDVIFTGSFEEKSKNNVQYVIDGDTPQGYIKPLTKEYYPGTLVKIDGLKKDDVFNGYLFKGWTLDNVDLNDDNTAFEMPNRDVVVRGEFEEARYTVTYAFYDGVLPPNGSSLIPATQSYRSGEIVTLPEVVAPNGYEFLGWYKENNFVMPEENITIYGEWKKISGTFAPEITKVVISDKEKYEPGDTVTFKVTIKNTANFEIRDLIVRENNDNAHFINGSGYTVESTHMAKINRIVAGGSIDLTATYEVLETDNSKVINEVELLGAIASNHYELERKDYKAIAQFIVKPKGDSTCKIIVHHYLKDTTEKITDDVISIGNAHQEYTSSETSVEGYILVKKPDNETFTYTYEDQEIIYEYEKIKFNITTKVIGGVGTITGDETVYYGDNSTPNNIVITPGNGYEILKVIVNGVEAPVTSKEKMILGSYENVRNNITIQVEFKERQAEVPITGSNSNYYIIGAIVIIIGAILTMIVLKKKKER